MGSAGDDDAAAVAVVSLARKSAPRRPTTPHVPSNRSSSGGGSSVVVLLQRSTKGVVKKVCAGRQRFRKGGQGSYGARARCVRGARAWRCERGAGRGERAADPPAGKAELKFHFFVLFESSKGARGLLARSPRGSSHCRIKRGKARDKGKLAQSKDKSEASQERTTPTKKERKKEEKTKEREEIHTVMK